MRLVTDFLVIGSGVAGQRAALSLAEVGQVTVLSKAHPRESNTGYAQGGIAAAVGPDDSPELHARDTIAAGDGLCDPQAVQALVTDGPRYVTELMEWGAAFDRDADGRPALGREAAHSVRRVLHARDATGREIGRVLWGRVRVHPRIRVFEDALALSLTWRTAPAWARRSSTRTASRPPPAPRARSSPPAARVTCFARPPTRSWPAATAWRWRSRPARGWPTSSSSSSTRPSSASPARPGSCCPRRCAARAGACSTRTARRSCSA